MVQRGLGERPLMFICHSLGGLLVKQILRKALDSTDSRRQQLTRSTRAVLFLATPHAGAILASLITSLRAVFGASVSLEDLRAHDANLRDLFDWYRHHAQNLQIETATYYEQQGVGGILPIVNPTSAHPGIGADPVGLDEDHLSIAKPRAPNSQVCGAARDLLRRHVLAPRNAISPQPPLQNAPAVPLKQEIVVKIGGPAPHRIPHELPPPAETFFGRPAELRKLTERLRTGKNSAVVGPAGMGKTALAAEAVRAVVGETADSLAASPFPDGVVFLDLYTFRGEAEPAWNALARKLGGAEFLPHAPARDRAIEACHARRILIVFEGGEEADGEGGRSDLKELFRVLSPQNRRLLLTRFGSQAVPVESVELKGALSPEDAANLLDSLAPGRVTGALRDRVLELLEGHPLALTWAGNLLARDDEDVGRLVREWQENLLPKLSDPLQATHTLNWLFQRSVRGLNDSTRKALIAGGLLARTPFPLAAISAALGVTDPQGELGVRVALQSLVRRSLLRRTGEPDQWLFTHVLGYRFARQEFRSDPVLLKRLTDWLYRYLSSELALSSSDSEPITLASALQHTAALLSADDDQSLWIPLAEYLLYDTYDRLVEMGRLTLADVALGAISSWLKRFPEAKSQEPVWLRERSSLLDRRGNLLRAQGDLDEALSAYREALAIRQFLATSQPSNIEWQRELGVSHAKVGDVRRVQGNLTEAFAAYHQALTGARQRVSVNPWVTNWQRDLSVLLEKLGDVLRAQGNFAAAFTAYQEALEIVRWLAEIDPSNPAWQRDLSVSHGKVGDVLDDQTNLPGALAAYLRSLEIQRLVSSDPSNATGQRDLAFCLSRIAQLYERQSHRAEALRFAVEGLEIDERLAALDPTNVIWQQDVKVGRALVARLKI